MEQFATGATLAFDGVDFQLRPNNEIECEITATTHELDDHGAHELAEHIKSVLAQLDSSSPEFAREVPNRSLSVSILSWSGHSTVQLCRVVDGKLQWLCDDIEQFITFLANSLRNGLRSLSLCDVPVKWLQVQN